MLQLLSAPVAAPGAANHCCLQQGWDKALPGLAGELDSLVPGRGGSHQWTTLVILT